MAALWIAYTQVKQTYVQLAAKYNCSARTMQRRLDAVQAERLTSFASVANVLMDTNYFGRNFGVMVFRDSITGVFLFKHYVKYETNQLYLSGIAEITRRGIKVQAIIYDGRKGLLTLLEGIPIQMCQFHQVQIVTRYLTRKPKTPAAVELRTLALQLTKMDKAAFTAALAAWLSLKRNLPWLFVFEQHKKLNLPNTTNALDGSFSALKNKLRNHNGLSLIRRSL